MERELFAVATYCTIYNVEHSFIDSLRNEGLIEITIENEGEFIPGEQLPDLEIYTRWHHELGINPAGIDAIRHLVKRLKDMQIELNSLKNRLRNYESDI